MLDADSKYDAADQRKDAAQQQSQQQIIPDNETARSHPDQQKYSSKGSSIANRIIH
jgi:hypothetical protein